MQSLGGIGGLLGLGMGGFGLVSNIINAYKQQQYMNTLLNLQKRYASLTPAAVSSGIRSMVQPLDAALLQNVGNATQGFLAERGLGQSPALATAVEAQAIAPYAQQNLSNAQQAYFQMLGLPLGVGNPQFPQSSLAGSFGMMNNPLVMYALLNRILNQGGGTDGGITYGTPPFLPDNVRVSPLPQFSPPLQLPPSTDTVQT